MPTPPPSPSPPPEWQITTEPNPEQTQAILTACRCGSQATFSTLYASTDPASRPPLAYCLYLASTIAQWPPLVAHILSLDTTPLISWGQVQSRKPEARGLEEGRIEEYVIFSMLSSVSRGDTAMVQVFLDTGHDQNYTLQYRRDQACFLERAVTSSQMTMARYLLARGGDANVDTYHPEFMPNTTVSDAAVWNMPGILRLLVLEGNGELGGSWALWNAAEMGAFDAAEALLDLGVDINEIFIMDESDIKGTALHATAIRNQPKFAEWLLRKGINPDLEDGNGRTAMAMAAVCGHPEVQQVLSTWTVNNN